MEEEITTPADSVGTAQGEQPETTSAQMSEVKSKKNVGEVFKNYFTATRIAYIAVFTALAFALRMLQFVVLPLPIVEQLKMDFSDTFTLIGSFALGPVAGVIIEVMKEVIYGLCFTKTAFAGELANIVVMLPLILIPSIAYKKYKGIKAVIVWLSVGCIVQVLWSFPVNLFLSFPVFVGFNWELGMSLYLKAWYLIMAFNLIKTVSLSIVTMLLYKPLSKLIKLTNEKFNKRKNKVQPTEEVTVEDKEEITEE